MGLLRVDDPGLAATVANVQRRAFCHFADTTERAQQLPAPEVGAVSVIGVLFEYWDGTHWTLFVGTPGPAGPTGPTGAPGPAGATGPAGPGVAIGGTTGQVLTKTSTTDYATTWATPSGTTILNGAGPPVGATGAIGNYYEDITNGVLYGPKANSGGSLILNDPFDTLANWSGGTLVAGRTGNGMQVGGSLTSAYTIPAGPLRSIGLTAQFSYKTSSIAVQPAICTVASGGTTDPQVTLRTDPTGAITALRGNTAGPVIGSTAAGLIAAATFYTIEFGVHIASGTGGMVTVKLNGTTVLNLTGVNTNPTGSALLDTFRCLSSSGANTVFDDMVMTTDDPAGPAWPVAVRQVPSGGARYG